MKKYLLLSLMLLCCIIVNSQNQQSVSIDYSTINPHPRLFLHKGGEKGIMNAVEMHPEFKRIYDYIVDQSDNYLVTPTLKHQMTGRRLLSVSREAIKRIFYLSFSYRMTNERIYALRAEQEMRAICMFDDWNPSHFLDVGEMTLALAIGYDWLFDCLRDDSKKMIKESIISKGFVPSKDKRYNWFLKSSNNWNQVCNAGMVLGALSIFEEAQDDSSFMIERALQTLGTCVKGYAPDGNYPEGYNYWGYGTTFNVFLIAALESALNTDAGLCDYPGFMESSKYMLYMAGTTGLAFNFSDARETKQAFPAQFWFADHQNDPSLLWNEIEFLRDNNSRFTAEEERFLPLSLIYGSHIDINKIEQPKENIWYGNGKTPVVLVRTNWEYGKGCYLGIKGGKAKESHGHMDAGSFVFEAMGVRWAQDMGMQEYNSLEQKGVNLWDSSQKGQRWDVFRYNNFVHNTLTVNEEKHIADAFVPINKIINKKSQLGAELDLSPLFAGNLKKAVRKIVLNNNEYLTITDELRTGEQDANVRWTMFTTASPKIIDDRNLELNKEGKRLRMVIESPVMASFKILDNTPDHDYDTPNPGSCRVTANVNIKANSKTTIKIKLIPVTD
ncbi:heparinase II/III family protein [uncultured Bacteroides sp.]|uniref:heparinase II/III domain-containing protein n=1 Tax=uncultured Bacteroides sp. TaxID=162156 RepID=UPI0026217A08|nr:heparinase II/III family protein [uncultured Bacteroides sp.]